MAVITVPGATWDTNNPVDDSDVLVPPSNTVDITTNLDAAPEYYDSIELARNYMHDLGSVGTYLKCNTEKLRVLHGGNAWIMSDDDANSGVTADPMLDTLIDTMEPSNHVYLASDVGAMNAGTVWHRIGINRGIVDLETSVIFATTGIVSVGTGGARLVLTAETGNGTAVPWLNVIGGRVDSDKTITRAYVANATLVQNTKPITYLVVGPGGTVIYQHTAGTNIEVLAGGHLDLRERLDEQTITYITVRKGGMLSGYDTKFHSGTLLDERE
jgi:hypothetical protein